MDAYHLKRKMQFHSMPNKTFTSISDRIKYKRDKTIYLDTTPKQITYELKQSLQTIACICK